MQMLSGSPNIRSSSSSGVSVRKFCGETVRSGRSGKGIGLARGGIAISFALPVMRTELYLKSACSACLGSLCERL